MASPRSFAGFALTLVAGAAIAYGVTGAYPGTTPAPARPVVKCPADPAKLAGATITVGTPLAELDCADLTGTTFRGVDLTQVSMRGAHAAGATFTGDNLGQADLTGADLRGAHFDRASLVQTTLTGANARGASFRSADMTQSDDAGTDLTGADLGGADLSQATLTGAVLRDADLTLAGLSQADLRHADLRGATLWLTGSIQAQTDGTRIGPVEAGVVQIPLLAAAVLWVLMALRLSRLVRRPTDAAVTAGDAATRGVIVGAVAFAGGLVAMLVLHDLVALWTVALVAPTVVFAVVAALGAVVGRYATAP
jgi:uncharacterized protein YjbI with pentapeptide repeats